MVPFLVIFPGTASQTSVLPKRSWLARLGTAIRSLRQRDEREQSHKNLGSENFAKTMGCKPVANLASLHVPCHILLELLLHLLLLCWVFEVIMTYIVHAFHRCLIVELHQLALLFWAVLVPTMAKVSPRNPCFVTNCQGTNLTPAPDPRFILLMFAKRLEGNWYDDEYLLYPFTCLSQSSAAKLFQGKYKALPGGLHTCLNDLPKTGWMVEWQRHTCFVNTIFLTTAANWKSILYNGKDSEAPHIWSRNESMRV